MSLAAKPELKTATDWMALPDDARVELIDGEFDAGEQEIANTPGAAAQVRRSALPAR